MYESKVAKLINEVHVSYDNYANSEYNLGSWWDDCGKCDLRDNNQVKFTCVSY